MLAGSTASARTGLPSRNASTWSRVAVVPSRGFTSTSAARDLKESAKDKLVEEGKKFAKTKLNESLGADETKQQAKNLSSSMSKILFAGLAVAGAAYLLMDGTTHAEEARPPTDSSNASRPKYTKDEVTLLCLVGPSLSGKTTQAKRLVKRFSDELDDIVSPKSLEELKGILASRSEGRKRTSLVVDNFPTTLEDAQRIEKELVPIFCFSYYDLPLKDFEKRLPKDDEEKTGKVEEFKKYTKSLEPLVKKYRDQGNIYEISADWDSADEVWEQVEAKTEQILELRERGDM